MRFATVLACMLCGYMSLAPAGVTLTPKGTATVWLQDQTIKGTVSGTGFGSGQLKVNGQAIPFTVSGTTFTVPVHLGAGTSTIVASIDSSGSTVNSDTLRLTLGYALRPVCYAYATVAGSNVTLHASILENADTSTLAFQWTARPKNPSLITLSGTADSVTSFVLPAGAPSGEYYFDVRVTTSHGDTSKAGTFVTVDSSRVRAFDITTDHAHWIDSAIVYGVTPYIFVANGRFYEVMAKLPEIASLGVTTLWIQPIYRTAQGGQGYDVTDYFSIRSDYGNENDLRSLITTAHNLGLHVILDFVPNHTSMSHPYAQDAIQKGAQSHYYDFYQRAFDTAPYASNYASETSGLMTFVYYNFFPTNLVNLNYSNAEVQRWIIEAGKYWIRKFDVDGYRVDANWAVNARNPDFMKQWRLALKQIKPEVFLLAEDKAASTEVFNHEFDAAYDWTAEQSWVSHWAWQSTYNANSNPTIFNSVAENQRSAALRAALTNKGAGFPPHAKIFHFMENNDLHRFIATHTIDQTKMVAAMMFSLNGIPLLYNGQEIGDTQFPYSEFLIYDGSASMKSQDTKGLFPFYTQIAHMREKTPALFSDSLSEVTVTPGASIYAFRRWQGGQNAFTLLNMAASAATAQLQIPVGQLALDSVRTYYLTDLLTNQSFSGTAQTLSTLSIPMNGYTTRVLLLDTVLVTGVGTEGIAANVPAELSLAQNFPNPFNPSTIIRFDLPSAGNVSLKVYDILGREVATLIDGVTAAGRHETVFDGTRLATGMYVYRIQVGSQSIVRKMLLVK